jgi:glycosyltransferase involved in cell wall biosynthesis
MGAGTPSVSACLIVRDEQEAIADCLRSVAPFVSEVVVVDTGSSDGTAEVAAGLGATVLHESWSDDFSAARNRALAACHGDWVLNVDADEIAVGVPGWLQVMLGECRDELDVLLVEIQQVGVGPSPSMHRETKLLRRGTCRWTGRVHERLVPSGRRALRRAQLPAPTLHLDHHGYSDANVARRKAIRNAALARLEYTELRVSDAADAEVARAALDLGRSLLASGDRTAAIQWLRTARRSGDAFVHAWASSFLDRAAAPDE